MENPIWAIRQELGINRDVLALMADLSYSAVAANEKGRYIEPSERVLRVFEELGYDTEQVKKEYRQWREEKRSTIVA